MNPCAEKKDEDRLDDHGDGVPVKRDDAVQGVEVEKRKQKLTDQHSTEIGIDSKTGNADKHKDEAQREDKTALQKGGMRFAETV